MLAAALDYAARGLPVFPLIAGDKKPLTEHGLKDASTDAAQIRQWWRKWRNANIGIPTGNASRWLAIDIDTKNGATYDDLAALGKLPPTMTAQTPSGGLHLVFRCPRDVEIRNSASKLLPGVDVRGEGGYICAAPSRTPAGQYEWVNDLEPAPLAHWLLKLLTEKPEPVASPIRKPSATPADTSDRDAYWLAKAMEKSCAGTGDGTGYWLAQQLYLDSGVKDVDGTMRAYARSATLNPSDPFDERSVSRWLASAASSNLVARGEPAKSSKPKPIRRKPAEPTPPVPPASLPPTASGTPPEPPDDAALLKGEADDNGNAEAMYRLFGREYLYTPAYGWLRYTGTHWTDEPEPLVAKKAIIALKRRRHAAVDADNETIIKATKADKSRVLGCLTLFKSYVIEPDVSAFDADPDKLNVKNGVLDLRTGKLTPHDPSQRFTYCVPVEYDPKADMSTWGAFLLDALGRDEVATAYFQLCAGYSLTGHTREEKMFYCHGPTRAGKGTVAETMLALLPRPLGVGADFATFTARRDGDSQNFDLAELKPARLVVASESNKYQALNPAKIKQLTGGDYVRCAFKHKDMFSYRPQFKVWLLSNHPVTADADDDALWGRVQVFTFPHSHLGREDVTLKGRLKSPENLRGVLRWAVEGAMQWYQLERLQPPETIIAATQEHRERQDFLRLWWEDCCTPEAETWTPSGVLLKSYRDWCDESGVKPMRQNEFADALVKRFGCTFKRQAGSGARGYNGVHVL